MYSGLGRLGQGASVSSCRSISSTILDAGRKMFSAAIALTLAEIVAETVEVTYLMERTHFRLERTHFRVERSDFGMERSDLERSNHGAI